MGGFSASTYGALKKYTDDAILTYLSSGSIPKGVWDASTNTPTITDGIGTVGWYYDVVKEGKWNGKNFLVGDKVIYTANNKWERVPIGEIGKITTVSGKILVGNKNISLIVPANNTVVNAYAMIGDELAPVEIRINGNNVIFELGTTLNVDVTCYIKCSRA